MQLISANAVTQGEHSEYHAVDIGPSPDPYYYAPEDSTVTAVDNSGTCGLRLELTGASGRHGLCHNETVLVSVGQKVKRGQRLAKMGYTGYTIPAGPPGTHVHWVIQQNGVYIFPLNLVNELFIKEGGNVFTEELRNVISDTLRYQPGVGADPGFMADLVGRPLLAESLKDWFVAFQKSQEFVDRKAQLEVPAKYKKVDKQLYEEVK